MTSDRLIAYTNDNTGKTLWIHKGRMIASNSMNAKTLSAAHEAVRYQADPDILEGIKFLISIEGLPINK